MALGGNCHFSVKNLVACVSILNRVSSGGGPDRQPRKGAKDVMPQKTPLMNPAPGDRLVRFVGDKIRYQVRLAEGTPPTGFRVPYFGTPSYVTLELHQGLACIKLDGHPAPNIHRCGKRYLAIFRPAWTKKQGVDPGPVIPDAMAGARAGARQRRGRWPREPSRGTRARAQAIG